MIAMLVRFDLSGHRESFGQTDGANSAPRYRSTPGLICKTFFNDPKTFQIGGFYLWESEDAMRAYLDTDGLGPATRKFGVEPTVSVFTASAFVQGPVFAPSEPILSGR